MQDIPRFVKLRGCINCDTSKKYKERHGTDYGFDHELQAVCLTSGCYNHGISLVNPFIDPVELVEMSKKFAESEVKENTQRYCLKVKERYGKYYNELGISLDELIDSI